jgi:WD40 repeat protein
VSVFLSAPSSPYKGLAPFEDSDLDALLFFGRERESEIIAANLMAARITVLYGPSGVGKSSVLRAGVAHRLRQEQGVKVVIFSTWTGDPVSALIEATGSSAGSLTDALAEAAAHAGGDLYLILDQFEELFLYHPRGGRFAEQLAEMFRSPGLRVNVLIGIREDALARLDALKAAIPNLLTNRLRLERLDRAAGEGAIVGPILRYNELASAPEVFDIEPALVDDVLDEVATGRVELSVGGRGVAAGGTDGDRIEAPYLQLVLSRLWDVEAERGSRTLRRETLRELGGAEHIVEDHLERAMAALSPSEKGAAAAMYNFLVTPSGTKIAHGVHDLAGYAAVDEREAREVLQRLSAERIVRASSENGPSTTRYEIFHDVLADAVLGWRTRFESERHLDEQQAEHERRQRRLITIGALALLGVAVMSAVAVYALAQRSNARHQAAVAQVQRTKAEQQEAIAKESSKESQQQAGIAKQQTKQTQAALKRAQVSERNAQAARLDALAQKATAEGNRLKAVRLAALADAARSTEQKAASIARLERKRAVRARSVTLRQKRIGHARELVASARALLDSNPQKSVETSLGAVKAFRQVRLAPSTALEDTLRDGLLALRLKVILRGGGAVRAAHFSPDGTRALVAGKGGARLYDLAHGFTVLRLKPSVGLLDAGFSPDGRLVAGAGADHALHVWDTATGVPVLTLRHDAAVLSLAFSPNNRLIATGGADGKARVWTVAGGLPVGAFTHEGTGARGDDVQAVSFSPDSSRVLTVGGDRFARIFTVGGPDTPLRLNNVVLINSARFSHNGKIVATGGSDLIVRTWNSITGEELDEFPTTGQTTDLAFSPDDRFLAAAGSIDTTARIWRVGTGDLVGIVSGHRSGVQSVNFSPDGRSVLTTGRDGKVFVSKSEGGFLQAALLGQRSSVPSASFSPDGRLVITAGDDGSARIWDSDLDASGPGPPGTARDLGSHLLAVTAVAYSPNGRLVLSAGLDGKAWLWRPDGTAVKLEHSDGVTSASFSKNGTFVITGSADGAARIWRVSNGALVAVLRHGAPVNVARLSPEGRTAVTAGTDGSARLWSVPGAKPLAILRHAKSINDARFDQSGRRLVTASEDGTAAVWRVTDGKLLAMLTGHNGAVVAAAFSPNGRHVATASADSTARIWDPRTGVSEHVLAEHTAALTALDFSPDGLQLATSSSDRDVRVWSVRSGDHLALLRLHSGPVLDVDFSADGRWLASAGPTAAGIWKTRRSGRWPTLPTYLVRGPTTRPLSHVVFSPRGWNLAIGSRDGSVRTFDCRLCGGIARLTTIGAARLAEIVVAKP